MACNADGPDAYSDQIHWCPNECREGAITITVDRVSSGVRFSLPTYVTGLGVITLSPSTNVVYNMWSFFDPFDWEVWFAILLTGIVLPILVWAGENLFLTGSIPWGGNVMQTWITAIFIGFNQMFFIEGMYVRAWPSMLVLICFNFVSHTLIMGDFIARPPPRRIPSCRLQAGSHLYAFLLHFFTCSSSWSWSAPTPPTWPQTLPRPPYRASQTPT